MSDLQRQSISNHVLQDSTYSYHSLIILVLTDDPVSELRASENNATHVGATASNLELDPLDELQRCFWTQIRQGSHSD